MEEEIKIDEAFKRDFNIGYRLAEELNLKSHILENQEKIMSSNPMHLGMQQFIDEAKLSKSKKLDNSLGRSKIDGAKKRKGKSRGRGPSL